MNRDHMLFRVATQPYTSKTRSREKKTAKQTSPEEMPVPKELTPPKPPSTDAQTSTDKLPVEDPNTNIKRTSSGRTVKPPTKLNLYVGSRFS